VRFGFGETVKLLCQDNSDRFFRAKMGTEPARLAVRCIDYTASRRRIRGNGELRADELAGVARVSKHQIRAVLFYGDDLILKGPLKETGMQRETAFGNLSVERTAFAVLPVGAGPSGHDPPRGVPTGAADRALFVIDHRLCRAPFHLRNSPMMMRPARASGERPAACSSVTQSASTDL
jgi:hypothetical protein